MSKLMSAAEYKKYKKNTEVVKQCCIDYIESIYFTEATPRQRTAMLIMMKSMLSSYTFTDYMTCRRAVELYSIGKTTYAEARQLMIQSEMFNWEKKQVNRRRYQILITPKALGMPVFIKNTNDQDFYEGRMYAFNKLSEVEFVTVLYSDNPEIFSFGVEKADTTNPKSVMYPYADISQDCSNDVSQSSESITDTLNLDNNFSEKEKPKFKTTIYAENSDFWHQFVLPKGEKFESDIVKLQKNKLEMVKVLEALGFRCFPVVSQSKMLGQSAGIKDVSKQQRIRAIYKTIFAQDFPKTEVDKGLRAWFGDEMIDYYEILENQEDLNAIKTIGGWRSKFNTAWACKDLGAFMGKNLVCLDCDDKETFKLLLSMLPSNTLAQNTRRGGHIFVKDTRKLLKNIVKIGNVDIIQGNAGVKIWDTNFVYEFIQGDLNNLHKITNDELTDIMTFLPSSKVIFTSDLAKESAMRNSRLLATKLSFIKFADSVESIDAKRLALNVLNVLQGKEPIAFRIPETCRNYTLFRVLGTVRGFGYDEEALEKVTALVENKYFEGADSFGKSASTLRQILKGKNKNGFEQKVPMFSRKLDICDAFKNLSIDYKRGTSDLPAILHLNSADSIFISA